MKRHRRHLVAHPGQDQDQRDKHAQRRAGAARRERPVDRAEVERAGNSEDPAHPVDHRSRGDPAIDEVLERGLLGAAIMLEEPGQDVGSEADQFQRQIGHQQVVRFGHQEHSERAGQ